MAVLEVVVIVSEQSPPQVSLGSRTDTAAWSYRVHLPGRVVYRINKLIQLVPLSIAKQTRLLVAAGVVDIHGRHRAPSQGEQVPSAYLPSLAHTLPTNEQV